MHENDKHITITIPRIIAHILGRLVRGGVRPFRPPPPPPPPPRIRHYHGLLGACLQPDTFVRSSLSGYVNSNVYNSSLVDRCKKNFCYLFTITTDVNGAKPTSVECSLATARATVPYWLPRTTRLSSYA